MKNLLYLLLFISFSCSKEKETIAVVLYNHTKSDFGLDARVEILTSAIRRMPKNILNRYP